ncbi:MAG TPA: two-component regulator propeller domain-containing protein [Vicinamibacteria bacterium]|nr:two-component regulator propeller domain-containing protein [Vicinamibacteria bacterium]
MRLRAHVVIAAFIGLAPARAASALDPHRALTQYGHDVWRTAEGLPQNAVLSVLQSRDGYLWLGTTAGLVRFDGVRFTVFDKTNTEAIGHNQISALFEDRDGSLWIGTFGGGLARRQDGRFTAYTTRDGLSHDVVKAITQAGDGALWVATLAHGINRFEGGRFTVYTTRNGLPHDDVFAVAPSRDGGIWIGTAGGLAHFHDGTFTTYTTRDGLPSNRILSVYEDRKGSLWAGTRDGGLARLRDGTFSVYTVADGLPSNAVSSIFEDRAGALWLATKDRALARLYDGRFSAYTTKEGLSSDSVYSVSEDREGSLWIATFGGGLNRLRDSRFTVFTTRNGLPHDHVRSVFQDVDGSVWVATFGGGLGHLENGRFTTLSRKDGLPHDRLYCVFRDRRGDLWIGTDGAGLVRRHDGRFTRYTTRNGLAHGNVRALYEDRQGSLWIGTSGGLSRLRDGRFTTYTTADGLPNDAVHAIHQDRSGALWLGTWGGGLGRFANGVFSVVARKDVPNDFILSFYEDREGSLWIGTLGGGLVRLREGRFRVYTTKEGLFEDIVYQVFEDSRENLWISCNKGVYRVARKELDDLDRGVVRSVRSLAFGVADGMPSGECSSGAQPLGGRGSDGSLWIPTQSGLVVIDPSRLRTNEVPPPVVIEGLLVDRRPVAIGGQPSLPPGDGDLEFHYTGLSFLVPGKVQFRYRLEGWNDEWVDAGSRRVAAYTNIPPGRYRFRVAAANADGVWNEAGASLELRLSPHFYQTWWFYGLVTMSLALAALGLHRLRVRQVEAEFAAVLAERTRMSRELHDTLAQGFAGIAIHLDAAADCLPKGAQELRGHIALARALVRDSLAEARRAVLDLRPRALEQAGLAAALSGMAERLGGTGSTIRVEVTGEPRRLTTTVEAHLLRIAQEAVTNALRHAGAREIRVRLGFGGESVSLRVEDDGRGFPVSPATAPATGHLGLVGIRERAARLGGQLTLHSREGEGTEVVVEVPLPPAATDQGRGPERTH